MVTGEHLPSLNNMDIISHGLRGAITVGRRNKTQFWLSFFFGMFPDLAAFAFPFVVALFMVIFWPITLSDFHEGVHMVGMNFITTVYPISHSLVVWAGAFLLLWAIFRKPVIASFAWLFHILLDIFTHSTEFFPTPFLWPISKVHFNGIPWHHAEILYPNIALLLIVYGYFIWRRWKRRKSLNT